jgi:hypothetical protein
VVAAVLVAVAKVVEMPTEIALLEAPILVVAVAVVLTPSTVARVAVLELLLFVTQMLVKVSLELV